MRHLVPAETVTYLEITVKLFSMSFGISIEIASGDFRNHWETNEFLRRCSTSSLRLGLSEF